jgi:hypothetical protein
MGHEHETAAHPKARRWGRITTDVLMAKILQFLQSG